MGSEEPRRHWQQYTGSRNAARTSTNPNADHDGLSTQQQANLPSDSRTRMSGPQAQTTSVFPTQPTVGQGALPSDPRTRMSGPQAQPTSVYPTQPTISQGAPTNLPVTFPSRPYGVGVQSSQSPSFPPATRTFSASGHPWEVESQPVVGGTPLQTQPQATPTARNIASPVTVSSRVSGSAAGHSLRPQCKVPGCHNSACFDNSINEQRYYCETHIRTVVRDGFAAPCRRCQRMPAHDNSDFCSRSCSNAGESGQQVVYQQPTNMTQPAPTLCEECRSSQAKLGKRFCSGTCANSHHARKQREGSSVYDSFKPTCQECRRPMEHAGRFCSRECEMANSRSSKR